MDGDGPGRTEDCGSQCVPDEKPTPVRSSVMQTPDRSGFRLATLERYEADLVTVEEALVSLDARDLARTATLIERIAGPEAARRDHPERAATEG